MDHSLLRSVKSLKKKPEQFSYFLGFKKNQLEEESSSETKKIRSQSAIESTILNTIKNNSERKPAHCTL